MAVPKHKKSKSKRDSRRAVYLRRSKVSSRSKCSRCGEPKLPHKVCLHCGYYADREVIAMEG